MTTAQGNSTPVAQNGGAPAAQDGDFSGAWRELRADDETQFSEIVAPATPEPEPPPDWLTDFMQWLADIFAPLGNLIVGSWPIIQWVLLAAVILLILYYLFETFRPGFHRKRRIKAEANEREEWVPQEQEAIALLDEADRLAEAGNYDEATHLLLKRSVAQIAVARPDLVEPSSTARELAAEPNLPDAARNAFGLIAAPVERSLFALRKLDREDWLAAREAYADFARVQGSLGNRALAA